jgi:creatinine amidohydrolase/Fe(II)-dependent formamide hydrolase-like protein
VFVYYNKLVMPKDILEVINERGRDFFPKLTGEDIAVLEDFVAKGKFDGHAGFGETAFVMGTYPELVRLDRAEAESGMSTHIADPISENGLIWGKAWKKNYPNAYCGHAPVGCSRAIGEAAVEIAVERTAKILKLLKDDEIMNKIIG